MQNKKAVGGYFELELRSGYEFHSELLRLNTGRNAFEYILKSQEYTKIYLPFYTCKVMLEPIKRLGIEYELYKIDSTLFPDFDFEKIQVDEVLVYTNYYGVCARNISKLDFEKNIILDNSQAFYSKPIEGVDSFYSARKFFGVPDGGYLYIKSEIDDILEIDCSIGRFKHLLGRIESGAEEFYGKFKQANSTLKNQPIKKMSMLTQRLMQNIDYNLTREIRIRNFNYLHKILCNINSLDVKLIEDDVPMVYPFLARNGVMIKDKLIKNKIYVPTYWPNVADLVGDNYFELDLLNNLVCLPIDQRINIENLDDILNLVLN